MSTHVYEPEARRKLAEGNDKGALDDLERAKTTWDIDRLEAIAGLAGEIRDRNEGRIKRRAELLVAELRDGRSRIAMRTFKRVATINFPTLGHANVMLASSNEVPADRVVREAETLLFRLLAARQVANLEDEESSQLIGQTLLGFTSGPDWRRYDCPKDGSLSPRWARLMRPGLRPQTGGSPRSAARRA